MNEIMNEVPDMLSGKDLDYLSDMFDWNYVLAKKAHHYSNEVNDQEIKDMILSVNDACMSNLNVILDVLNSKVKSEGR